MLDYLIRIVTDYCCCGKKRRLVEEIKEDIKFLTDQELNHLRAHLIRPLRDKHSCC